MNRFFVKHKLDIGDITHLSDTDSIFAIEKLNLKVETFVEVETYEAIFLGIVTDISKNSVEVEITKRLEEKERIESIGITLVQALLGKNNFNFFLEKCVEIGIDRVIPVQTKYSHIKKNKAIKEYGLWKKIVSDATEQSRNIKPTIVEKPTTLNKLNLTEENKICLTTENIQTVSLKQYLESIDINKPIALAIGPEKGWSTKDIEILKEKGFKFVKLEGNILRSESVGIVVGSIIAYLKGEI
jgi:16S rRNA (uracil1498-N3)-methyltransferase